MNRLRASSTRCIHLSCVSAPQRPESRSKIYQCRLAEISSALQAFERDMVFNEQKYLRLRNDVDVQNDGLVSKGTFVTSKNGG
jgi:hypothetical protein